MSATRRPRSGCLYTRLQSRPLVTERKKGQCVHIRAPRALKPRLIIAHTPNIAGPRQKTARAAAPRAYTHDLRHDGITAVLNSARAAVEPRASLRTAPPRPVARPPSRRAPKKSRSRAARAAPTDKKAQSAPARTQKINAQVVAAAAETSSRTAERFVDSGENQAAPPYSLVRGRSAPAISVRASPTVGPAQARVSGHGGGNALKESRWYRRHA